MVGSNIRSEAMSLMDKRGVMEGEIDTIIARLTGPGGPGVKGSLVDSEVREAWLYEYLFSIIACSWAHGLVGSCSRFECDVGLASSRKERTKYRALKFLQ